MSPLRPKRKFSQANASVSCVFQSRHLGATGREKGKPSIFGRSIIEQTHKVDLIGYAHKSP